MIAGPETEVMGDSLLHAILRHLDAIGWMPPTLMIGRTIRFLAGLIVMARAARMVRSRLWRLR